MGSLSKKTSQSIEKIPEKVPEKKSEAKIAGTGSLTNAHVDTEIVAPKVTECYGCGEVFTAEDLTSYKQKWYCQPCLDAKKADVAAAKASKPTGLTEDAVKAIVETMLPNLDNYFTRPDVLDAIQKALREFQFPIGDKIAMRAELQDSVTILDTRITAVATLVDDLRKNAKFRDMIVRAVTIMEHFTKLERFTSPKMNKKQGDDMRAFILAANALLEGK